MCWNMIVQEVGGGGGGGVTYTWEYGVEAWGDVVMGWGVGAGERGWNLSQRLPVFSGHLHTKTIWPRGDHYRQVPL